MNIAIDILLAAVTLALFNAVYVAVGVVVAQRAYGHLTFTIEQTFAVFCWPAVVLVACLNALTSKSKDKESA